MITAFRVDAHPGIGFGHVMRCLTLANALAEMDTHCVFLCAGIDPSMTALIEASGHEVLKLDSPIPGDSFHAGWELSPVADQEQKLDFEACMGALVSRAVDRIVVDHYLLDANWEQRWQTGQMIVIDDLANRQHACHLLVDQNLGRKSGDYSGLVQSGSTVLIGPDFALLRPEFAKLRSTALAKRRATKSAQNILVNFGAGDGNGIMLSVLQALSELDLELEIRAICTSAASQVELLSVFCRDRPRFKLLLDRRDMAQQMVWADLAIGASGASSWERCALGLPTIAIELAENQRLLNEQLAASGAIERAEIVGEIVDHVRTLVAESARWQAMVACCSAIADGRGTIRVRQEILGHDMDDRLRVRKATMDDALNLWAWRNEPVARQMARDTRPVPLESHYRWLDATLASPDRVLLVGDAFGESAGTIRLDFYGDVAEISINIARPLRRRKLGTAFLRQGLSYVAAHTDCGHIRALVRPENAASRRLFESCGYIESGSDGDCIVYRLAVRPHTDEYSVRGQTFPLRDETSN